MSRARFAAGGADLRFLPVGVAGLIVASLMLATGRARLPTSPQAAGPGEPAS
jgi:hypothetical protein